MFNIEQKGENIIVVKPEFNFDIDNLDNVKELRKELEAYISGVDSPKILINFENVTYVDSTGLGNIIRIFEMIRKKKGTLSVSNLNVDVEKIFKITTLDTLIKIYDTENNALSNMGS